MKLKIITHIIESLVIGGAETLLVNNVKELSIRGVKNIIISLVPINEFQSIDADEVFYIDYKSKPFYRVVKEIRGIINDSKSDVVHSHLLKADFLARVSTPKNIPHFYTVHSRTSGIFNRHLSKFLREKYSLLYKKESYPIFVSNDCKLDYQKNIKKINQGIVLSNYIDDNYYKAGVYKDTYSSEKILKLAMVGSLKKVKNHEFVIKALSLCDSGSYVLDIYGKGSLKEELMLKIKALKLNINIIDNSFSLHERLLDYDVYLMSSLNEGNSLALIEAMTLGLPLFLSDIPSFREMANDSAMYFQLNNPKELSENIMNTYDGNIDLKAMSLQTKKEASKFLRKNIYIDSLINFYNKH